MIKYFVKYSRLEFHGQPGAYQGCTEVFAMKSDSKHDAFSLKERPEERRSLIFCETLRAQSTPKPLYNAYKDEHLIP